jgi:hypothetical protein
MTSSFDIARGAAARSHECGFDGRGYAYFPELGLQIHSASQGSWGEPDDETRILIEAGRCHVCGRPLAECRADSTPWGSERARLAGRFAAGESNDGITTADLRPRLVPAIPPRKKIWLYQTRTGVKTK